MQGLHLIRLHRVTVFLKYQELGLSCNKKELATERRPRISRSICHGITRKRHGRKQRQKQKNLPRINTELHRKDTEIRLNKRGQVSFSALNIICSWFRLAAEKETWPLLFFRSKKHLPRNYTEKTLKRHTHLSEPDAWATVALILSSVISLL